MSTPIWILCPILNNLQMSLDAIGDFLDQSVPTRVLVINQGSTDEVRQALEREAELKPDRLFVWSHEPPLPSLAATWNRALDFVWETGGMGAFVMNNDVHLHPWTCERLAQVLLTTEAYFVSAVAVTPDQYESARDVALGEFVRPKSGQTTLVPSSPGGPDFSCFLISKVGHQKYRFDEHHVPAYCEDLTYHREMMLGGDGERIFSVNLPYLHFASGTLKDMSPEKRAKKEQQISQSRAYYEQVWGGPVNAERFTRKGDPSSARDGVSTPELQRMVQAGESVRAFLDGGRSIAIPDSLG